MQKEPTIKELLKAIEKLKLHEKDGLGSDIHMEDLVIFGNLKKGIKQLRKENKRLKKELVFTKINSGIGQACFDIATKQRDLLRKELETPNPVAEFKCAKTNKPSEPGWYIVLSQRPVGIGYAVLHFTNSWSLCYNDQEILAFTETSPEQILKVLNNGR